MRLFIVKYIPVNQEAHSCPSPRRRALGTSSFFSGRLPTICTLLSIVAVRFAHSLRQSEWPQRSHSIPLRPLQPACCSVLMLTRPLQCLQLFVVIHRYPEAADMLMRLSRYCSILVERPLTLLQQLQSINTRVHREEGEGGKMAM